MQISPQVNRPDESSDSEVRAAYSDAFGEYRRQIAEIRTQNATHPRRTLRARLALDDGFREYRTALGRLRGGKRRISGTN